LKIGCYFSGGNCESTVSVLLSFGKYFLDAVRHCSMVSFFPVHSASPTDPMIVAGCLGHLKTLILDAPQTSSPVHLDGLNRPLSCNDQPSHPKLAQLSSVKAVARCGPPFSHPFSQCSWGGRIKRQVEGGTSFLCIWLLCITIQHYGFPRQGFDSRALLKT